MEEQDGISVHPMRLKVLYTFDDESKTNCLARWPHLIDIQTAFLDEETQVGVIELRTCIQAIVSASPELVAKLGRDYTVYAYDYSEYETPLVGQGMLSWVLASASPTPNAPAHQSKTMVTGRVCRNTGLFARGAQETLEVKLKLVPVPTILQSEYLDSMQKYRDLSNVIPQDFDPQAWTGFVQANPELFAGSNADEISERESSNVNRSGIENFHRILSEGSTPRDIPSMGNIRADSPAQFTNTVPSRTSTPGIVRPASQQQKRAAEESSRPLSRASFHNTKFTCRRNSVLSGYGSSDEINEGPVQKRAKLMRPDPSGVNMNIERQPSSLRVAASTAASVRIHRPTPMHPANRAVQASNDDPVRPPTPIPSMANPSSRRPARPAQSGLRRQSTFELSSQGPSYLPDDGFSEVNATSPLDEQRDGPAETPFNMPSSPPMMDMGCPQTSSPIRPLFADHDSGFMSGDFEPLDDDMLPEDKGAQYASEYQSHRTIASSSDSSTRPEIPSTTERSTTPSHPRQLQARNPAPIQPRKTISRPSSRASVRNKPLAPAPATHQRTNPEPARLSLPPVPASDPIQPVQDRQVPTQACPMSDMPTVSTPGPSNLVDGRPRSGTGARRVKQVQARLDQCIKEGTVPPYCENCGAIETTTWRRAWSKVIEGNEDDAKAVSDDPRMLFWEAVDKDPDGTVTSYRQFKKSLANQDKDYVQLLLCNACGLWLHKFKLMRPENKWNRPQPKDKRKRSSNRRPPAVPAASTRSQSKLLEAKDSESSSPPEASSPQETDMTQKNSKQKGTKQVSNPRKKTKRANSAEPPKSTQKDNRWQQEDPHEALRRAIQSSPARNMDMRKSVFKETNLTPNPVRRALFPPKTGSTSKTLSATPVNAIRRSPRSSPRGSKKTARPEPNQRSPADGLDHLFEGEDDDAMDLEPPNSPTPKQKNRPSTVQPTQSDDKENNTPSKDLENQDAPEDLQVEDFDTAQNIEPGLSLWNSPMSRSFNAIDGLMMDIIDSDQESIAQTDSYYPFVPPKSSIDGDWTDWNPSQFTSPNEEQLTDCKTDKENDLTNPGPTPNEASESHNIAEEEFSSLLLTSNNDFPSFTDPSALSDTDLFDPALVDPQLLSGMWSKEGLLATPGKATEVEHFDTEAFATLIQEVTGSST